MGIDISTLFAPFVTNGQKVKTRPSVAPVQEEITHKLQGKSSDLDLRMSTLMKAAQAGDRGAYAELLNASLPLIKNLAQQAGASGDKLEAIMEETLMVVHRVRQSYDPSRSFVTWLTEITWHLATDKIQRKRRSWVMRQIGYALEKLYLNSAVCKSQSPSLSDGRECLSGHSSGA